MTYYIKILYIIKTLISTQCFNSFWSLVSTILQLDICKLNVFNEFKEAETFVLVTKSSPNPNPDPKPWSETHFPYTILRLFEFSGLPSRLLFSISSLFLSPLLHITLISLTLSLSPSLCSQRGRCG